LNSNFWGFLLIPCSNEIQSAMKGNITRGDNRKYQNEEISQDFSFSANP
jgi:hypothetical protein